MKFCVPADHPSLLGHFPGRPIVPAVVLLNCVLDVAAQSHGKAVIAVLDQAKFLAPLLPLEEVDATLSVEGTLLRFKVTRGTALIAQGSFLLRDALP